MVRATVAERRHESLMENVDKGNPETAKLALIYALDF